MSTLPLAVVWTSLAILAALMHYVYAVRLRRTANRGRAAGINGSLALGAKILVVNQVMKTLTMMLLSCTGLFAIFLVQTHAAGWFLIPLPVISIVGTYFDYRYQRKLMRLQVEHHE